MFSGWVHWCVHGDPPHGGRPQQHHQDSEVRQSMIRRISVSMCFTGFLTIMSSFWFTKLSGEWNMFTQPESFTGETGPGLWFDSVIYNLNNLLSSLPCLWTTYLQYISVQGPEALQHRCERGLRAKDPRLWVGAAHWEWDDGLCGHQVVPSPRDYAQLDALQPNRSAFKIFW